MAQITYRSLLALTQTASSSRVLNLNYPRAPLPDPNSGEKPFFASRALNRAIIIKHRMRAHEAELAGGSLRTATKVVIPLVADDLKLGGQAFFVNQRGYRDLVASFNENSPEDAERDLRLLNLLDDLPSLDPFLLKELLDRNGFKIDPSYFAISEADQRAMNEFVIGEIEPLLRLSFGMLDVGPTAISRIANKVLNSNDDDEVAPIRAAFRMTAEEYRVRAFSWKGFLYYKWKMRAEMPRIAEVAGHIRAVNPNKVQDHFLRESITEARNIIVRNLHMAASDVFKALRLYESAFDQFVGAQDARGFQRFLIMAPSMFLQVGVRLGVLSHIQSYWTYRFPAGSRIRTDYEELGELLQEMVSSLEFEPFSIGEAVAEDPARTTVQA